MELIKAEWQEDKKHVIATYKMLGTDFRNQLIKEQNKDIQKKINVTYTSELNCNINIKIKVDECNGKVMCGRDCSFMTITKLNEICCTLFDIKLICDNRCELCIDKFKKELL